MLNSLINSALVGATSRNLDTKKFILLVGTAKEINFSGIRIPDNVLQIEEELEEEGLFDILMALRPYLILQTEWELGNDWLTVVNRIQMATGVVMEKSTVNLDTKQEYYRETPITPKEYGARFSTAQPESGSALWSSNDWLAVLWLLSFIPLGELEKLR